MTERYPGFEIKLSRMKAHLEVASDILHNSSKMVRNSSMAFCVLVQDLGFEEVRKISAADATGRRERMIRMSMRQHAPKLYKEYLGLFNKP